MFLLLTRSGSSGSAFLAISSFNQVPCTWTSSLIFQATVASPTLWPQRGHRPGWQTRQIVIQRSTEVKGLKKLDDILLKWLAEYTRQGLKGLKNLEDSGAGEQIQGPNAGCVFVLHKYKESYLFVHVCTNPLQNYSDDVSICLMYIWSYFKLHNFKFTRVLRFRTCAHHMWGAGQWLQKLIPKVCIHGDSYTLKESVGWHKRCGGTMGHHCRDLWSDPGSLCSPCAEELIHPLTFRRIVKSSEELRSLQSQSNRNCPKITG